MDISAIQDKDWRTSTERKYYHNDKYFVKRCFKAAEFYRSKNGPHVPLRRIDRLKNEAATLEFIRAETDIPVPAVISHFFEDDAYYLVTEYIHGCRMLDLREDQKATVRGELQMYTQKLKRLTSTRLGGPSGIVIPPLRALRHVPAMKWDLEESDLSGEYVFCHNDLSQQNILVDPETLKIKAIIDWEYAGFFPQWFEWPFYIHAGAASTGGCDDEDLILDFLVARNKHDEHEQQPAPTYRWKLA